MQVETTRPELRSSRRCGLRTLYERCFSRIVFDACEGSSLRACSVRDEHDAILLQTYN